MATQSEKPKCYSLLGIRPDATAVDVKKGYRQMARLKHPDKHGNSAAATEEFQRLQQAYETLSNPRTRYSYDQTIAGELEAFNQERARNASLLDCAQKHVTGIKPSVEYKRRLFEGLELRLRQKQRAYDTEQRRILNAQAVVIINDSDDDDPPETTRPPRNNTGHAAREPGETEVIGEMPRRTVQDLSLAKQDLRKAATDMRDAELTLKEVKNEIEVHKGRLRKSEQECTELEREHNPRWWNSEAAAQASGQAPFQPLGSGHDSMFQRHPSHYEAPQHPRNSSLMPTLHGPYQAPQTSSPRPPFCFAGPPSGQKQHPQRPRSYSIHSEMPPPQWSYHPPPPQQPWPQHVRPEANPHQSQYEATKAEIERLTARNLENDRSIKRLVQKNLALVDEVQRLKRMLDQANSAIEKKRGRAEGNGSDSNDMGEKGVKTARRF